MSATAKRYAPKAQKKTYRNSLYAKLHVLWSKLRPDLAKGTDEYKEALYGFTEQELGIARIGSMTELTDAKLLTLIKVLEREAGQPSLFKEPVSGVSGNVVAFTPNQKGKEKKEVTNTKPVEHLASGEQCFAINRIFGYLGWSTSGREKFMENKCRTTEARRLTKKQAHSFINILLRCAASKYWKAQGHDTVSNPMIKAAIPTIKRQIGIY
jgi:hypothetical protein